MSAFARPKKPPAAPEKHGPPAVGPRTAPSAGGENAFAIATRDGGIGVQRVRTPTQGGPFGSIVEDDVAPGPGQIRRIEFVTKAVAAIESVSTSELARFGKTARDCPYLAYYVRYYRDKPAAHIERMIARYARPKGTDPPSLLTAILERVRTAISLWALTGKVELPETPLGPAGGATRAVFGFDGPVTARDPQAVRASLGAGHPLDAATRSRMERGFGRDFGDVRVHSDAAAGRTATSLSARAFAVGSDIAFGTGQYRPGTARGDVMLAHELAHVVQQGGSGAVPLAFSSSNDTALEADADQAALSAVARSGMAPEAIAEHVAVHTATPGAGLRLQRCSGGLSDAEAMAGSVDVKEAAPTELSGIYEAARRPTMPGEQEHEYYGESGIRTRYFFYVDADGDGSAELKVWFDVTERSKPYSYAVKAQMTVVQLSSKEKKTVDLDLGDIPRSFSVFPQLRRASDGFSPTELEIDGVGGGWGSMTMLIDPPSSPGVPTYKWRWSTHPAAGVGRAVKADGELAFKKAEATLFNMWQPDDPRSAAGIWTIDAKVGPYAERFRFTFLKPDPSKDKVVVGVSAFTTGAGGASTPWGAQSTDTITCPDHLRVKTVENRGARLGLELSEKGGCRIDLYDRFEGGHEGYDIGWYIPKESRNRTHTFSVVQGGTSHGFGRFEVSEGKMTIGMTGARSATFPAASGAMAIEVLEPLVASGFDFSKEAAAVLKARSAARDKAVAEGAISKETNAAFNSLATSWAGLVSQLGMAATKKPGADVPTSKSAVVAAIAVYRPRLVAEVPTYGVGDPEKNDRMYSERISHLRHRFTGEQFVAPRSISHGNWGLPSEVDLKGLASSEAPTIDRFVGAVKAERWAEAAGQFHLLAIQIDRWVAFELAKMPGHENESEQLETLALLSQRMRSLAAKKPLVVHAVFHIHDKYKQEGKISPADNIPLRLYAWHDDTNWYLEDLTDPRKEYKDHYKYTKPAKPEDPDEPPHELFLKLNWKEHFPKGLIRYVLPSGHYDAVETTAEPEWYDYLAYAAAALAVAAIVIGTAGAGAPLAGTVATTLFVTSGILQATASIAHLHDMAEHGHRDPAKEALDVLNIIASLAGAGAIGARALLTAGRVGAAADLAGSALAAKSAAATALHVLSFVAISTDAANLVVSTAEFIEQYDAIDSAPGMGDSDRLEAKALLILKFAGTTALTVWSVKGGVDDLRLAMKAGKALKYDILTGGVAGRKGVVDVRGEWEHADYTKELEARLAGTPAEDLKSTKVTVVDDPAEWKRLTSGSELGAAVVRNEGGVPVLYVRKGAHPSRIAEEAIHLVQLKDPHLAKLFAKLDEAKLAKWPTLKPAERVDILKAKLDLEIDAQRRLIKDIAGREPGAANFAALDGAYQSLEHLQGKYLDLVSMKPSDLDKLAKAGATPELLEDVPRLFNKTVTEGFGVDQSWRMLDEASFIAAYRAKYPYPSRSSLSDADLKARYHASKRLSPDTWRLVDVSREPAPKPHVTAEYEGPPRVYTGEPTSGSSGLPFATYGDRKKFDEAFKARDRAREKAEKIRADPNFETDLAVRSAWGKAMAEMREQSRIIGEMAGMEAVQKEFGHLGTLELESRRSRQGLPLRRLRPRLHPHHQGGKEDGDRGRSQGWLGRPRRGVGGRRHLRPAGHQALLRLHHGQDGGRNSRHGLRPHRHPGRGRGEVPPRQGEDPDRCDLGSQHPRQRRGEHLRPVEVITAASGTWGSAPRGAGSGGRKRRRASAPSTRAHRARARRARRSQALPGSIHIGATAPRSATGSRGSRPRHAAGPHPGPPEEDIPTRPPGGSPDRG